MQDRTSAGEDPARLIAENIQLVERLSRLGPTLAAMARELAEARRENTVLRRENARLRGSGGERRARAEPGTRPQRGGRSTRAAA